jgi:uracil-DNA glycosylase family 4
MKDELEYYKKIEFGLNNNNYFLVQQLNNIQRFTQFFGQIDKKGWLFPSGGVFNIMFVGTNPGQSSSLKTLWEDRFGKYFGKMLDSAGIDVNEVWMTNLHKKKTPGNRPLTEKEIKAGLKILDYEIDFVQPKIICLLGSQVGGAYNIPIGKKGKIRNFNAITIAHPSYIKRFGQDEMGRYITRIKNLKKYL